MNEKEIEEMKNNHRTGGIWGTTRTCNKCFEEESKCVCEESYD